MATWLCYPNNFKQAGTLTLANGTVLNVGPGFEEDLVYINNQPYSIDGADQVLQSIRKDLKTFKGEWFLDAGYGTPWTQAILIKNPPAADANIKKIIANAWGVLAITAFNYAYVAGKIGKSIISFSVQSQYGPLSGTVEVL